METEKIIDFICKINEELGNLNSDFLVTYCTTGFVESIEYGEVTIWDSENNERDYEKEDLEIFVRKQINKIAESMSNVKL